MYGKSNMESYIVAAAKSLQSCPTLCDPMDCSPPGSPVHGILQARTMEWVAISSSNAWKWKVKVKSLSCVQLLATTWTAAYQAPLSMGFSRQEYWSGCHCLLQSYITIYKIDSQQEFAVWLRKRKQVLCINLEGWDGEGDEREVQRERIYVYLWLIHVEVWQKTAKFCKAIILQWKINTFKKEEKFVK